MDNSQLLLKNWIDKIIIGLNLCPFAKDSMPKLKTQKMSFTDTDLLLDTVLSISDKIIKKDVSNAIIYTDEKMSFNKLNDICLDFQDVLDQMSIKIKLVAFHPDFVFEDLEYEDKANLVNRSPIALIHLISKDEIAKVVQNFENAKNISLNNEKKLKQMNNQEYSSLFNYLDKK